MHLLKIIIIIGVVGIATAAVVTLGGDITGFSIFGGDSQDSISDFNQGGIGGGSNIDNLDPADIPDFPMDEPNNTEEIIKKPTSHSSRSCTENLINTTAGNWTNISCLSSDLMNQSRNFTEYDSKNCRSFTNTTYEAYRQNLTCDNCTPVAINTSWSDWNNDGSCRSNDTQLQNKSRIEYDNESCYEITSLANDNFTNITHWDFQEIFCDYCTPNMVNTSWSDWSNLSCTGSQMNQSRNLTEYDSNVCGEVSNTTFYEYQLVGPTYVNTSWSDWLNISCLSDDTMNQSRNLTQSDIYGCASNTIFFEYRNTEFCDNCTPNWTAYNTTCNGTEVTEYYVDSNNCYDQTGLESDNAPVNNSYSCSAEICDFIDNDLDGEIDENGCANIYGVLNDTEETPVVGANISFYDSSIYDPFDDSGNYSVLIPKEVPDAVTDENGEYNVSIEEGIYHMVIQSSDEKDFNIQANRSKGKNKHDLEIDETREEGYDFNAEGHILFSGKYGYEEENSYVCGDQVKFTMFGVNHEEADETITFLVEDHTGGVNDGESVYDGDMDDENESLTIEAGNKTHGEFNFTIPCDLDLGKYDIHVVWDDGVEEAKWHKIGNFFIVNDTTIPEINTWGETTGFPGENITIEYSAMNHAEPGTVRAQEYNILGDLNSSLIIEVDKNSNGSVEYSITGGNSQINLTYEASGNYTARFTVIDTAGNEDYEDVNITIYITEEEADGIATLIYTEFGLFDGDFYYDMFELNIMGGIEVDRYNQGTWGYQIGDEYITTIDNIDEEDAENMNTNINACGGAPYVRMIFPTTEEEYNQTLYNFLSHVYNDC